MHTGTTRHTTDGMPTARNRVRAIAYWAATSVIVAELVAGSVWNLMTIEWVDIQLSHLGYPDYFAHILGVCHVGAAVAIIVPGFPLIKEWAYAGVLFLWSGAVVSHVALGDGIQTWGAPLAFAALAVASWALRPADRRLPGARSADERDGAGSRTRLRSWGIAIGLVVALYAVSFLTLPLAEAAMREQAVELGWIDG